MNPVKLKFRHGGEMLVSPIGLRFVEDPDHGPLVLIPEFGQPRGYQLDMTLEEAEQAFRADQTQVEAIAKKVYWLQEQLEKAEKGWTAHELRLDDQLQATHSLEARIREFGGRLTGIEARFGRLFDDYCRHEDGNDDRWQALQIHLGLPEGWEHLHEGAAEVKGALVSQAEMLDSLKAHVDALYSELGLNSRWEGEKLVSYRDTDSILTEVVLMQREVSRLTEEASLFTVAERVGELEEAHQRLRERTGLIELNVASLGQRLPKDRDTAFPLLGDRTCVQRQTWTVPQSVDRTETGRIEDEVSRLHGELDARVSDLENRMDEEQSRIRTPWIGPDTVRLVLPEPEKPKSAWRPLRECYVYGRILIRKDVTLASVSATKTESGIHLDFFPAGWFPNTDQSEYSFCPIPE